MIRFVDDATMQFDSRYDAYKKITASENIPQIYTVGDVMYAVNMVPFAESVNLNFQCGTDGEYSIEVSDIDRIGNVWLEDKFTGDYVNLMDGPYTFGYHSDDDPARFIVSFSPVSVEEKSDDEIVVFAYQNRLNIQLAAFTGGDYTVYDIQGRLIRNGSLTGMTTSLPIYRKGYYIVSVNTAEGHVITRKVLIN